MAGRHLPGAWLEERPDLAAQWDYSRNEIDPTTLSAGAHTRVWWTNCPNDRRHYWHTELKSRIAGGQGCSVCRGFQVIPGVNDLATLRPDIAAQWHQENDRGAHEVAVAARYRAKWRGCPNDERHEWVASVDSRTTQDSGCTVCLGFTVIAGVNDLASQFPEVAATWDFGKNELTPDRVSTTSGRQVNWVCVIGHEWRATVASRTAVGTGCPVCSGKKALAGFNDLASLRPDVARDWDHKRNRLGPEDVTPGSGFAAAWLCPSGHRWKAVVHSRTRPNGSGCPTCNTGSSEVERTLRRYLYRYSTAARYEPNAASIDVRWGSSQRAAVDAIGVLQEPQKRQVVVEFDGWYWHSPPARWASDTLKTASLLAAGYLVVRLRGNFRGRRLAAFDYTHPNLLLLDVEEDPKTLRASLEGAVTRIDRWLEDVIDEAA